MAFSALDILAEFVEAAGLVAPEQREFDFAGHVFATKRRTSMRRTVPRPAKTAAQLAEAGRRYRREHNARRLPYLRAMKRRRWAEIKANEPERYRATLAVYRRRNATNRMKKRRSANA